MRWREKRAHHLCEKFHIKISVFGAMPKWEIEKTTTTEDTKRKQQTHTPSHTSKIQMTNDKLKIIQQTFHFVYWQNLIFSTSFIRCCCYFSSVCFINTKHRCICGWSLNVMRRRQRCGLVTKFSFSFSFTIFSFCHSILLFRCSKKEETFCCCFLLLFVCWYE